MRKFFQKIFRRDKKIKIIFVSAGAVLCGLAAFFLTFWAINHPQYFNFTSRFSSKHTITLTKNGFYPPLLVIHQGDTVNFISNAGQSFWPASDPHPTHTIYPEFDPKKPIEANQSWSFVFNKVGSWGYHDHLAPLFTARIIVLPNGSKNNGTLLQPQSLSVSQCHIISDTSQQMQCWEDLLNQVIQSQGIKASFGTFTQLYNTEPYFAQNCHGFTHQIGQAAYQKYANHEDFGVTEQVAYCSYGFFHGFIEAMFQDQGNLDQARSFCDYIDKQLEGQTAALTPCLHGIGHGVTDGSDQSAWGNVFALINPGLALCEKVGTDDYEKMICATGVFNSLEGMYLDPKYKITIDKNDPYWICRQQKTQYFEDGCYQDLKDVVMTISNNDFPTAAKYVEAIKDDSFANAAMDNLATYYAYWVLRQPNFDYAIKQCQALQTRLHDSCVAGLGAGFMTAGIPDLEYVKAIQLCQSKLLNQDEKTACFQRVLHASSLRYSPEKHKQVCALAGSDAKLSQDCSLN